MEKGSPISLGHSNSLSLVVVIWGGLGGLTGEGLCHCVTVSLGASFVQFPRYSQFSVGFFVVQDVSSQLFQSPYLCLAITDPNPLEY